jgi:hypothetical protein
LAPETAGRTESLRPLGNGRLTQERHHRPTDRRRHRLDGLIEPSRRVRDGQVHRHNFVLESLEYRRDPVLIPRAAIGAGNQDKGRN